MVRRPGHRILAGRQVCGRGHIHLCGPVFPASGDEDHHGAQLPVCAGVHRDGPAAAYDFRDEKGQKMSKSKGNTIDPVQIIEKYGCDALRFTMTSLCTYAGQDIKISDERFEYGRNFANKLWNASRFVLMNLEGVDSKNPDKDSLTLADKWILTKLNTTIKVVTQNMEKYELGNASGELQQFVWDDFCDYYIELTKPYVYNENKEIRANAVAVLKDVYINITEIKQPDLNAQLVAENIALQLEKRVSFRRALKQSIGRAMKLGAKGIKTQVSGRVGGAEIARTESYHEGTIPLQTIRADIDYGFAEAKTTYGRLGVKVWIYNGESLHESRRNKKREGGAK